MSWYHSVESGVPDMRKSRICRVILVQLQFLRGELLCKANQPVGLQ